MRYFLFLFCCLSFSWGQDPVKWSAQARQTDTNTYDVILKANIQDNWKLYDVSLPDGGPLPTVLLWKNATAVGALQGSKPKTGYDVIFEMDLAYYTKELMWVQSVSTEDATIELLVEYQACDDALCIFREEPLSIPTDGSLVNAVERDLTDVQLGGNNLKLDLKNTELLEASGPNIKAS